jgi:hypothetical protein
MIHAIQITNKFVIFGSIFVALVFSACATAYGPRNSMGGYEDKVVGENMIEVRFYGNQHTTKEETARRLLFRCAEITFI